MMSAYGVFTSALFLIALPLFGASQSAEKINENLLFICACESCTMLILFVVYVLLPLHLGGIHSGLHQTRTLRPTRSLARCFSNAKLPVT